MYVAEVSHHSNILIILELLCYNCLYTVIIEQHGLHSSGNFKRIMESENEIIIEEKSI